MRIFDFDSYKTYLSARLVDMPRSGRGQFRKISAHLKMHTTMVSQVFRGDKNLSLEQACLLADYLGLNAMEQDFLITQVEKERAGSKRLKELFQKRLQDIREQAKQIGSRLPSAEPMSEEANAIFYSQWFYCAIRLLTSIQGYQQSDRLAEYFRLPNAIVNRALEFLISTGLCVERQGRIEMGPQRTHVPADSPLVVCHHTNWRLKAIERFPALSSSELAFTSPMTLSDQDADRVKEMLSELIGRTASVVESSPSEQLYCLNIDWMRVV